MKKNKNQTTSWITAGIIFTIVSVLFIIIFWYHIKSSFFSISISDVINNILTFFVGFIIAIFLGIHYTNKNKQYELIIVVLDMYIADIKLVVDRIYSYIYGNRENYEKDDFTSEMLHLLRISSNDLNTVANMYKDCGFSELDMQKYKNSMLEFKLAITQRQFRDVSDLKNAASDITNCYYSMKNDMHMLKLSFYK